MFRNRYAASNNQRNFIRQRYSVFNVSSQVPLIERNFEMDGKYHQFIIILYMIIYLFSAICYFLEDAGIVNDFQVEMDDCNGETGRFNKNNCGRESAIRIITPRFLGK